MHTHARKSSVFVRKREWGQQMVLVVREMMVANSRDEVSHRLCAAAAVAAVSRDKFNDGNKMCVLEICICCFSSLCFFRAEYRA